jgi:peptide-methionine (R)-S-oxide reductase
MRKKGTEKPFSGTYNTHFEEGTYSCKGCNSDLFDSTMKFESHCGWPSFDNEIEGDKINKIEDSSFDMLRTEIVCNNCGSHLGHIFNDGPTATNLRYCVNSVSINFNKKTKK